jgi:tetratricopeptide (TPR) repeat protein
MMTRLIAAGFLSCAFLFAQESQEKTAPAVKTKIIQGSSKVEVTPEVPEISSPFLVDPSVEAAIPTAVKKLGIPAMINFPNGVLMAVTSSSERVQAHVNQGLNHLHGGWDFEASRHFAAAMREDPECLLAQWGMVMSLLTPAPETGAAATASATRLLDLLDKGNGTALERGYAYALIKYIQNGPVGASDAFRKIAAEFPNDLQSRIFASLFNRSGYDEFGTASADQLAAEKSLMALIVSHPDSSLPLNALLSIRAEAPDLTPSLELARKLCDMAPGYPPYLHLLGHYEWRCGNHAEAITAFSRAALAYQGWMKENQVPLADSPEWFKSESYRIAALSSKGDFDLAYAAALEMAALTIPAERAASPGNRSLMWDVKALPARLLLNRGKPGDASQALKTLPKLSGDKTAASAPLSEWWIGGLTFALDAHRLIDEGKLEDAQNVIATLTRHGDEMAKTRKAASLSGEISAWNRSFRALEILSSNLRAHLTLAGPKERRGTAYNWLASAAERQEPDGMMFPPVILTPISRHIGEFYMTLQQPTEAIDFYQRALTAFPNDMQSLLGLREAYLLAKLPQEAEKVGQQIERLRSH